jgi:hypothetical protein
LSYLVENNLINIDSDLFCGKENKTKLVENLLQIWKSDPVNHLKILLRRIEENIIELDSSDQRTINQYFINSNGDNKIKLNVQVKFDEESEFFTNWKKIMKQSEENNDVNKEEDEKDKMVDISLTKIFFRLLFR